MNYSKMNFKLKIAIVVDYYRSKKFAAISSGIRAPFTKIERESQIHFRLDQFNPIEEWNKGRSKMPKRFIRPSWSQCKFLA